MCIPLFKLTFANLELDKDKTTVIEKKNLNPGHFIIGQLNSGRN